MQLEEQMSRVREKCCPFLIEVLTIVFHSVYQVVDLVREGLIETIQIKCNPALFFLL